MSNSIIKHLKMDNNGRICINDLVCKIAKVRKNAMVHIILVTDNEMKEKGFMIKICNKEDVKADDVILGERKMDEKGRIMVGSLLEQEILEMSFCCAYKGELYICRDD